MAKNTGEGHMTQGGKYVEDSPAGMKSMEKERNRSMSGGKKVGSSVTGNPHKNTGEPVKGMNSY